MRGKATVAVSATLVAALAAVFYLWFGNPNDQSRPFAQTSDSTRIASTATIADRNTSPIPEQGQLEPFAPSNTPAEITDTQRPLEGKSPPEEAPRRGHPTFPEDTESRIWQVLSANQHLGFTSIDRVTCRSTICEIHFTGGPDLTDTNGSMMLWSPLNEALPMIKSGMISGRVEKSPGVYSSIFVIRSYIGSELIKEVPIGVL